MQKLTLLQHRWYFPSAVVGFHPLALQAEGVLSLPVSVRLSVNFTLSAR